MRIPFIAGSVVLATLLVVYVGCGFTPNMEAVAEFQAAQKAFDQAASPDDYLKVAAMYGEMLDRGVRSGAILYNQGNAFMKAGRRGQAVAAYLEAKRYLPSNPYLEANLRFATGGLAASEPKPLVEHILFWQNWISYGAKFVLAAAGAAALFTFALVWLFRPEPLFRRLTLAMAVVFAVLAFSAAYDWYRFDYVTHGVVTGDEVVARKGNSTTYEPAFTEALPPGTEFRVLETRGDWLLVSLSGDKQGWIEKTQTALF